MGIVAGRGVAEDDPVDRREDAEGQITVRKARQQLEAEGFLHTRRFQHPETGHWTTRVLVSNVPLRTPAEIDAAFMAPGDRFRTVGERTGQAVGESPQEGNREEQNTSHPAEPDEPATPLLARAARLLHGLGHREAKLRLGVAEAAKLAPLAERWLANGASELELRTALVSGLPPAVHSPVGFLTRRLTDKLPAPRRVTDPAAPAPALPECAQCGDPLLPGQPGQPAGLCTPCTGAVPPASERAPAGLSGAALARAGIVRLSPRPRPPHRPRKGHKRQLIPSL